MTKSNAHKRARRTHTHTHTCTMDIYTKERHFDIKCIEIKQYVYTGYVCERARVCVFKQFVIVIICCCCFLFSHGSISNLLFLTHCSLLHSSHRCILFILLHRHRNVYSIPVQFLFPLLECYFTLLYFT